MVLSFMGSGVLGFSVSWFLSFSVSLFIGFVVSGFIVLFGVLRLFDYWLCCVVVCPALFVLCVGL